jgi:nicotinamidase-related amidase
MSQQITPDTALVLIDVQKGIDDAAHWGGNRNNPIAEQNIERLLKHWRAHKFPIVVIQHCSVEPASPFRPGHSGNALKDFVKVGPGEKLIQKSATSAFAQTELLDYLKSQKINTLVIVGFVTNNSVEATARTSGDLGFKTIVVADATATFDKKHHGTKYDSHLIHSISLANLEGEYASICNTDDLLT